MIKLCIDNTSKLHEFHLYEPYLYGLLKNDKFYMINDFVNDNSDIKSFNMCKKENKQMRNNPGLSSLILGIVMNVVNLIMTCVMFTTGYMLFGGIFVIFPIIGIVNGVKGIRGGQGLVAVIALILNIIATIGALILAVLGIIGNAMA